MGLIRKALSASTVGLVDWKSDKERAAASARKTKVQARKTKREAKKTNALLEEQNALLRAQLEEQRKSARPE